MEPEMDMGLDRLHFNWIATKRHLVLILLFILGTALPLPAAVGTHRPADVSHTTPSMATLSIREFESEVKNTPEVMAAIVELDQSVSHLEEVQAQTGMRVFVGSDIGEYREYVVQDRLRDYTRFNLRAGLKYPLLGSRNAEEEDILSAKVLTREKVYEKEMALRNSMLAVRRQFILYWAAQEKIKAAQAFLENDHNIIAALAHRANKGLLLEADRLEFMSAIDLVRRHLSDQQGVKKRSLSMLRFMTKWEGDEFEARFPQLDRPCLDFDLLNMEMENSHPEILVIKEKMADQKELVELSDKSQIDGHASLVSHVGTEFTESEPGYGVALNVQIDFPLKPGKLASARRKSARAGLEKLKHELEITRAKLQFQARQTLDRFESGHYNIAHGMRRLSATQERVREDLLRYAYLAGDVIEKVQRSRQEAYLSAIDVIDAQALRLQDQAVLLSLASDSGQYQCLPPSQGDTWIDTEKQIAPIILETLSLPESVLEKMEQEPSKVEANALSGLSVYVWRSDRLPYQPFTLVRFFNRMKSQGIDRMMVSFTPEQIAALEDRSYRRRLENFLLAAKQNGMRVELLLGEPLWILPQHRSALVDLINAFSDLPFEGLHLDLEPDQLPDLERDRSWVLNQWCETIRAAKAATSLPVGISVHYRYLQDQGENCLGRALEALALDEIILMIYVANPDRVHEIADPILERYPGVRFSIAQSVESELSPEESYRKLSKRNLFAQLSELRTRFERPNFGSIVVQSWEALNMMEP